MSNETATSEVVAYSLTIPDVDQPPPRHLVDDLTATERERMARFAHQRDRTRFTLGRFLLREAGSRVIGGSPGDVQIEVDDEGRPSIGGFAGTVSLAHSGRLVLAAAAAVKVGVDVQEIATRARVPGLEARLCSPSELIELQEFDADARWRALMTIWVRKEAYGKAVGVGLRFTLRDVTVGLRGHSVHGVDGEWQLLDLNLASEGSPTSDSYLGAVVIEGSHWRARLEPLDYPATAPA